MGPLTYVGFGGCVVLAASLGVSIIHGLRVEEGREHDRAEYATKVADAEAATAATEARYRKREQERSADVATLNNEIDDLKDKLSASRTRASAAAQQLLDAERAYVALQASRTSKDPATACVVNAESTTMFQQLHRETDDFAQLAAGSADSLAAQLMLLQHYVRDVCHN